MTTGRTPRDVYPSQYARMDAFRVLRHKYSREYRRIFDRVPKGDNRTNAASVILAHRHWKEYKLEYYKALGIYG
jgi:hypothetical protein